MKKEFSIDWIDRIVSLNGKRMSFEELSDLAESNEQFRGKHVEIAALGRFWRLSKIANFIPDSERNICCIETESPMRNQKNASVILTLRKPTSFSGGIGSDICRMCALSDMVLVSNIAEDGLVRLSFIVENTWVA